MSPSSISSYFLLEAKVVKHIIDCDTDPFIPEGWKVEEHKKGGQFEWNATKVRLHLVETQVKGSIKGHKLRKLLTNEPTLNANVLDYLLKNPHLIPEEWKNESILSIFFWGTIYLDPSGNLFVRYLHWYGEQWGSADSLLDERWYSDVPALLAS